MKRTKVDIPLPPEPSSRMSKLLDKLSVAASKRRSTPMLPDEYDEIPSEDFSEEWDVLLKMGKVEETHKGYINVCRTWEGPFVTTHKVYTVVKVRELDTGYKRKKVEYYKIFFRRVCEEDLHDPEDSNDGEFGRYMIRRVVEMGKDEAEWLAEAHFIRADGSMSPSFYLDRVAYRKAFAFPAGVEIPYGTKRNRSRVIFTRLTEEQTAEFLNRALYFEAMGDPRSADPIHPFEGW